MEKKSTYIIKTRRDNEMESRKKECREGNKQGWAKTRGRMRHQTLGRDNKVICSTVVSNGGFHIHAF